MFRFAFLGIVVWGIVYGCCLPASAAPPTLKTVPDDEVMLGNAYVDAWQTLRFDFDTLQHGDAHPELIHEWLHASPDELLLDFIHHGQNATLVLLAAQELSTRTSKKWTKEFSALQKQWKQSPLKMQFAALRVLGGDTVFTQKLKQRLTESGDYIRISAAETLAIAKNVEGIKALHEELSNCGSQVYRAAWALARVGKETERKWLEHGIAAGCEADVLEAAAGEILFRKWFPFHYELLKRRDASESRYRVNGGMYSVWFRFARYADTQGVHTAAAFADAAMRFKDFALLWPNRDAQLVKRNLDALVDFFRNASDIIQRHGTTPSWPESFKEATYALKDITEEGFEPRVSAAVSLLRTLTPRLELARLRESSEAHSLSPRGSRAMDGNWRTSWQGKKGDSLILEWQKPVYLEQVVLATGCAQSPGGEVQQAAVKVMAKSGEQTVIGIFDKDARFYQAVPISADDVRRIEIQVTQVWNGAIACIPELRVITR